MKAYTVVGDFENGRVFSHYTMQFRIFRSCISCNFRDKQQERSVQNITEESMYQEVESFWLRLKFTTVKENVKVQEELRSKEQESI